MLTVGCRGTRSTQRFNRRRTELQVPTYTTVADRSRTLRSTSYQLPGVYS